MKFFTSFIVVCSLVLPVQAQDAETVFPDSMSTCITALLDTVHAPDWKLHFGIFQLPVLSHLQQMKKQYGNFLTDITILEEEIAYKENQLKEKKEELGKFLSGEWAETNSSTLLLGLFKHEKKIKGVNTLYNQKSLFWGAIKWGKRKPAASEQKQNM